MKRKKWSYFAPLLITFLLFPLNSYAYSDSYSDDDSNYYSQSDDSSYYRGYNGDTYDTDYYNDRPSHSYYRRRQQANEWDDASPYYDEAPRHKKRYARVSHQQDEDDGDNSKYSSIGSRLPDHISPPGEKVIVVDPRVHAWGAYTADGNLVHAGMATSGSSYCRDLKRPCRTRVGTFRIYSLGSADCFSRKFPLGKGGAPMPYCMYFNGGQGLHGSYEVADANLSHGCVRMHVNDAEWLRFNFARVGTKVVIKPY